MTVLGGTEGVGAAIKALIETKLVDELRQMEQERGFGQGTLSVRPDGTNRTSGLVPSLISATERPELDLNQYPAVLIEAEGVPSTQFMETLAANHDPEDDEVEFDGDLYMRIYGVRLMVYVTGVGWEETRQNRDRLEYALWRCLMRNRAISPEIVVERNTLATSYLDVTPAKANKMQSGFRMRINVRVSELISTSSAPLANRIETEIERL